MLLKHPDLCPKINPLPAICVSVKRVAKRLLSFLPLINLREEDSWRGSQPPSSLVPRLHAITYRKLKHTNPLLPLSVTDQGMLGFDPLDTPPRGFSGLNIPLSHFTCALQSCGRPPPPCTPYVKTCCACLPAFLVAMPLRQSTQS